MKLCFVYSNRSEFSEIEPFYQEFKNKHFVKLLDLSKSIKNIDDDVNLGKIYSTCYNLFLKERFDYLVVLGDRRELPLVVIPAFLLGIKIIHLAAGDQAESLTTYDQYIRPIVSTMSTLQICFSKMSKKNIEKIFASIPYLESNAYFVGNPVFKNINIKKLERPYKESYDIVLLHPQSLSTVETKNDIKTVENLLEDKKTIFIKGNNDLNANLIFNFYKKIKSNKKYIFSESLNKEKYFSLIKFCDRFITNSSSIDEINFLNKKCLISIGQRNKNRNHDEFNNKAPEKLLKILEKQIR